MNRFLWIRKWFIYDKVVQKRDWTSKEEKPLTVLKTNCNPKEVLMCCSRTVKEYETKLWTYYTQRKCYCLQLNKLIRVELQKKAPVFLNRNGINIFHRNNKQSFCCKIKNELILVTNHELSVFNSRNFTIGLLFYCYKITCVLSKFLILLI